MFRKMKEWFSSYGHTDRQLNDDKNPKWWLQCFRLETGLIEMMVNLMTIIMD